MSIDASKLQADYDVQRRSVDAEYFDLSLRELVRMTQENEVRIAPEFQRQFRWKDDIQSALIESFLLGLPIPAIFVATNQDGTWEVVDGLQRICTVLRFMGIDAPESPRLHFSSDRLRLKNLQTLTGFENVAYEDLPRAIRLTFERRFLRVQVLSDRSDPELRFELFRRLNAGAVELTYQEIRACVFRGPFNSMIIELAEDEEYNRLLKLQQKDQKNATSEEVVLKFFAYLDWPDKYDGKVAKFLNDYMKDRSTMTDVTAYRALFKKSVEHLGRSLEGPFLRSGTNITPVNQFEAVLVGIARVIRGGKDPVIPPSDWLNDELLVQFSTKGTNTRTNFHGRINRAEELFAPK